MHILDIKIMYIHTVQNLFKCIKENGETDAVYYGNILKQKGHIYLSLHQCVMVSNERSTETV